MEEIQIITPEELKKKLEEGEKLELVDVREYEEVAARNDTGCQTYPDGGDSC